MFTFAVKKEKNRRKIMTFRLQNIPILRTLLICLMAALTLPSSAQNFDDVLADSVREAIVDVSKQKYSYQEMLDDLSQLAERYPEFLSYELRDTTYQGRQIPLVMLGNAESGRFVMVQASMHAREYMATLLVMAMLEHYAESYRRNTLYKDVSLRDVFQQVCFVILPMVNPDGVEIAQRGVDGAVTEDVRSWVRRNTRAGVRSDQIKSNARGVDLNRNFYNGFGRDRRRVSSKSYSYYPGAQPCSEVESRFLLDVSAQHDYALFLNYHTKGNLVYYGCKNAPADINDAALRLSRIIKSHTAYPLYGPNTTPPNGSWADEVEVRYRRPSVTIELGTRNPVPISEFPGLFAKNQWVWADVALAVVSGEF